MLIEQNGVNNVVISIDAEKIIRQNPILFHD